MRYELPGAAMHQLDATGVRTSGAGRNFARSTAGIVFSMAALSAGDTVEIVRPFQGG